MRILALLVCVAGCSGKDDGPTAGDTGPPTGGTRPVDPCGSIPEFDYDSLDCEPLGSAYEQTIEAAEACTTAEDCVVLDPVCADWNAVGCWYAANVCLQGHEVDGERVLTTFATASSGCSIPGMTCEPCGSPPAVDCVSGRCQIPD